MRLQDIYQTTTNPLDDDLIRQIKDIFITTEHPYNHLIKINQTTMNQEKYPEKAGEFECKLFNIWKNNIINHPENFIYNGDYSIYALKDKLERTNSPRNMEELTKLKEEIISDYNTEIAYRRHGYHVPGSHASSYWQQFDSPSLNGLNTRGVGKIDHRIYVNADYKITYDLLSNFIDKCQNKKVPFYFKYTNRSSRDDGIVFYASNQVLPKYIEILEEIKKEHPEYDSHLGKPPALSAAIDNWMGYGSEPIETGILSFNSKREDLINESLRCATNTWISENRDNIINVDGKRMPYKEYLARNLTEEDLLDIKYQVYSKYERRYPDLTAKIESSTFKKALHMKYQQVIDDIINDKKNNEFTDGDNYISDENNIKIKISPTEKIILDKNVVNDIYYRETAKINRNREEEFFSIFKNSIENNLEKYDIDKNNFAFDLHISKGLQKKSKVELLKPRNRDINESEEEYVKYLSDFYTKSKSKDIDKMFEESSNGPTEIYEKSYKK